MRVICFFICLCIVIFVSHTLSYAGVVDFNTWSAAGSTSAVWSVSQDGREVVQSKRMDSIAYFLSPQDYIDVSFHGSFGVNTTYDDDFIGFVFGYKGSNDYLLFDWKQADNFLKRGDAYEGFTLADVHGANINLWDHSGRDISVLASDYESGKGWEDNTLYSFDLNYTSSNINIAIDNIPIFNVSGSFAPGRLGLYVYSQEKVEYKDFRIEDYKNINVVPEPSTIIVLCMGLILLFYIRLGSIFGC